jgi:hypothetical protein
MSVSGGESEGDRAYGDDQVVLRDGLGDVDVCHGEGDRGGVSSVRRCHGGRIGEVSDAAAMARVAIGMRARVKPPPACPAAV